MIRLDRINKHYGRKQVLHDFDIEIADNEFIVLLGPSGCGKSTLLRVIAGLEQVTSGQIIFDGEVVNELPPRERNIAMVFQDYALYGHKTCFKNISFNMELDKVDKTTIRNNVYSIAKLLDIEDSLSAYPAQLSGGQQQRIGMGRALVRDPALFLFDEPLSNLDAKLRTEMCTEISRLHRQMGKTTIYVTHDQSEAMTLADRLMIMNNGVVEQSGAPLELYDKPKNTFVAGFLGSPSINFIEGRIVRDGGQFYFSNGTQPLFEVANYAEVLDQAVILGIRPEDIHIGDPETAALTAEIELVEQLGHVAYVFVSLDCHRLCVALQKRTRLEVGERVGITVAKDAMHIFDANAGQRAIAPA